MGNPEIHRSPITIEQLAERWHISVDTAWATVRDNHIPAVPVGSARYNANSRGPKTVVFLLDTIERWERAHEIPMGVVPEVKPAKPPIIAGWDGVDRFKRRGRGSNPKRS